MSQILNILQGLPKDEYNLLMMAFENETTHIINLPNMRFIGVNVQETNTYVIERSEGAWAYGKRIR